MRRTSILIAALLGLSACSTPQVNGTSALAGKQLEDAIGLFGPWDQSLPLDGAPTYIWRRHAVQNGVDYYCEMRVELGFRHTVGRASMRGYPVACELFDIHHQSRNK
ncbi:MAG: hypothetical protein JWQ52_14 [Phenylobacterium sp.]|nr:hypothetical protein [Phenylobacterium sp.]